MQTMKIKNVIAHIFAAMRTCMQLHAHLNHLKAHPLLDLHDRGKFLLAFVRTLQGSNMSGCRDRENYFPGPADVHKYKSPPYVQYCIR